LRQLETPFVFPLDAGAFYDMPIGSIRSYSISGGVQLPIDFGGILDKSSRDLLLKIGDLTETVPYAVFKRRLSYQRPAPRRAFGLGRLEGDLARRPRRQSFPRQSLFPVERGACATVFGWHWVWPGIAVGVLPINLALEQALAKLYDQVYEYDLRKLPRASLSAGGARRLPAFARALPRRQGKGRDTGVVFHFTRTQERSEEIVRNGPNFAVFKRERQGELDDSEIEITDGDGKFYVLETSRETNDKMADLLVGEEERRIQQA